MEISVLLVVPSQEPLAESATAFFERRPASIPMQLAEMPKGVRLDTSIPAIPIGTGRIEDATRASFLASESETFAVRGVVEAESLEDVPAEIEGRSVFADPQIEPFITCGGSSPVGNHNTVATKLDVAGLTAKRLTGDKVAIVIMDTGIDLSHLKTQLGRTPRVDASNSWTPPGVSTTPFHYPTDHGTMCAFDALIAAPEATLVDFPILSTSAAGGSVVGRTISIALLGFSQLIANWAVAFAGSGLRKYNGLVVSNSWGIYHPSWDFPQGHPGRYSDNPNHPFNQIVSMLANSGADILFAAGNCGADCPDQRCQGGTTGAIMGANAHPDVLTLAGCDTDDLRVGYSSQGPSIAGMFQNKPDLTTYTHFLGSEAFGPGTPDSGTSASCPVAAGCVAAIRTKEGPTTSPPSSLFAQLNLTARFPAGQTAWNGDYGHGILDPVAAANSLGL